jgi:hypothetical protein
MWSVNSPGIAVEIGITAYPRTEPDVPDQGIRLPRWVFDSVALARPGMKDARFRKPAVGEPKDACPEGRVALPAAT